MVGTMIVEMFWILWMRVLLDRFAHNSGLGMHTHSVSSCPCSPICLLPSHTVWLVAVVAGWHSALLSPLHVYPMHCVHDSPPISPPNVSVFWDIILLNASFQMDQCPGDRDWSLHFLHPCNYFVSLLIVTVIHPINCAEAELKSYSGSTCKRNCAEAEKERCTLPVFILFTTVMLQMHCHKQSTCLCAVRHTHEFYLLESGTGDSRRR